MARKAKIGDVCEIKTPVGLAYVQYTHDHPSMGQLMRVLPGMYPNRPDLGKLAQEKELYYLFYPLHYSIRDRKLEVAANEAVPRWAKPYPPMRASWGEDRTGKTLRWLITDASKEFTLDEIPKMLHVDDLTPEQRRFSPYQLWSHEAVVQRLTEGWTPEREEEFRLKHIAEAEARTKAEAVFPPEPKAQSLDHYLYFPQKSQAITAGERLKAKGWTVEVKKGADGESWLALAKQPAPIEDDIEDVRDELESLAEELGGEYDGWGAAV